MLVNQAQLTFAALAMGENNVGINKNHKCVKMIHVVSHKLLTVYLFFSHTAMI